jgi:hypothetical protein
MIEEQISNHDVEEINFFEKMYQDGQINRDSKDEQIQLINSRIKNRNEKRQDKKYGDIVVPDGNVLLNFDFTIFKDNIECLCFRTKTDINTIDLNKEANTFLKDSLKSVIMEYPYCGFNVMHRKGLNSSLVVEVVCNNSAEDEEDINSTLSDVD